MPEYLTESGLVVSDRRARSAEIMGPISRVATPRELPMIPKVQPWDGWPAEWDTPRWGGSFTLAEMAARVSVVFGAIDLNASILATMPPYRTQGARVIDPLPWMLNPQPEVYTGWIEAMEQVFISYMGGEAFLWATSRYADNSVRTWVMLTPAWVDVKQEGQVLRYELGGDDITDDILHLRYKSWPGNPHGIGPLEALASNLFGAAAMEKYQAGLATRGGIPWGVLTAPGNLSAPQATELRDNFVAARLSARGAPAVLSGGVQLTPLYINPKDMALLELRQFDEARIATLLGVPPTLLSLPSGEGSMVYRNVQGIYDFHWRASLKPKADKITQAISNWALPHGQSVELNRDAYVQPPLGERMAVWEKAFNMYDPVTGKRLLELDEIRAIERFRTASESGAPSVSAVVPG